MQSWLALTLSSILLWGMWGFLSKVSSDYLTPKSIAVMQGVGFGVVTIVLLASIRFKPDLHTGGALAAVLAGTFMAVGIIAFVFALNNGGKASIVVPLTALYPVVTILLSVAILKEQLSPIHGLGIAFALVAAILLSR